MGYIRKIMFGVWMMFCCVFVCGIQAEAESEAVWDGDYKYTVLEDGTVEIVAYKGMEKQIIVPDTWKGRAVTSIGQLAFSDCSSLISIEIPSSVTNIGKHAFIYCSNLTSIEIPSSVTSIGEGAFIGCSSLTSIEIPSNVTSIEDDVFCKCISLRRIELPSGITSIGEHAFIGCSNLSSIEIPSNVTSIGEWAFGGCSSLTSIEIPSSVTSIGEGACRECNQNMIIYVEPDSYAEQWVNFCGYRKGFILSDEECRVYSLFEDEEYPTVAYAGTTDGNATVITIPDTVTINNIVYKVACIADNAFAGNEKITKVVVGNNVKSIGKNAFSDCTALKEVVLAEAVENISNDAFEGVAEPDDALNLIIPENLEDISNVGIENINNIQCITIYVTEGSQAEIYLQQFDTVTYRKQFLSTGDEEEKSPDLEQKQEVEDLVTEQETLNPKPKQMPQVGVIYTVDGLKYKVTSSQYVTFVGTSNKSIKTLTIPAKVTILEQSLQVTAIQKRAMKKCTKLTTVVIGSDVKNIGDEAFMNCSNLKKIVIGKNVKVIGKKAFNGDKKLERISFKGTKLSRIGKKALSKVPKKVKITAPKKAKKKYKKMLNCAK